MPRRRLPLHATALTNLFAEVEYALRRNGYVRRDQPKAFIDWALFARELGEEFFSEVRDSGRAVELVREPPRAYYRDIGLHPEMPDPIGGIVDLFVRGVCQVRNNIEHGEKFVESATPRDHALTREALWVLKKAIAEHPRAREFLAAQPAK
jgi:hypothetical protein